MEVKLPVLILLVAISTVAVADPIYLGSMISLPGDQSHGCKGDNVGILDEQTIEILGFNYADGNETQTGQYAWFVLGNSPEEAMKMGSADGAKLRPLTIVHHDVNNPCQNKTPAYKDARVTLHLPIDATIKDYTVLSLTCLQADVTFCYKLIPPGIQADPVEYLSQLKFCTKEEVEYLGDTVFPQPGQVSTFSYDLLGAPHRVSPTLGLLIFSVLFLRTMF